MRIYHPAQISSFAGWAKNNLPIFENRRLKTGGFVCQVSKPRFLGGNEIERAYR
jgi:hypothetical protein